MKVLVVAGDKRHEYLCRKYKSSGIECVHFNKEDLSSIDNDFSLIILPVPLTKDAVHLFSDDKNFLCPIEEFFDSIKKNQYVICFGLNDKYPQMLKRKNIMYADLMKDTDFIEYNSLLTAQGAVCLMLENTSQCVFGKKALVTGFGFVSKALCRVLYNFGLDVTVCARNNNALNEAKCKGYNAESFDEIRNRINEFDFIFGTVPARVFYEDDIISMKDTAIYFELASAPFGVDRVLFDKYNKKYAFGGGLPGKYCPEAWADAVFDYCINREGM